ncbi:protein kinase [Rhizobium leguminosarum]|nr:protein kinase [Rhizobium leguminosarum]
MSSKRSALPKGYTLEGYQIEEVLGAGGFGITYLALDPALKRQFAIKEFCPHDLSGREGYSLHPLSDAAGEDYERGLRDFIREAQTLARFHHRNIVGVARIFEANNTAYMVLNFERGESLKDWLKERDTPLTQEEMDRIAAPLLDALSVIHADSILHRDVAPDNVYIRTDGTPVLLDFGAARQSVSQRSRSVSAIVKAGYSPQEQYSTRATNQGPWTDIYALGATFYRCLTGEAPPEASDRTIEETYVPLAGRKLTGYRQTFLEAIDWALRSRPKERPQTVGVWLGPLLKNAKVPEQPKSPERADAEPGAPVRRLPHIALFACVAVVMIGLGAGATAMFFTSRFASIQNEAQRRLSQSQLDVKDALKASKDSRDTFDALRKSSVAELERFRQEIDQSQARSSALETQLKSVKESANHAGDADRQRFEREARDLQTEIDEERRRATALDQAQRDSRTQLQARVEELQKQLSDELAAKQSAQKEADALRNASEPRTVSYAGLNLVATPAGDGQIVQSVDPESLFFGKIKASDVLTSLSRNGEPIDFSTTGRMPTLAACDALVAQVADSGTAARTVTLTMPYALGGGKGSDSVPVLRELDLGSPLASAGLKPGDRITEVAGMQVETVAKLSEALSAAASRGRPVPIAFLRDCAVKPMMLTVDFGSGFKRFDWGGLVFAADGGSRPKLVAINQGGALSGAGMQIGDELKAVTVNHLDTALPTMEEAAAFFAATGLCGRVQLRFMRENMRVAEVDLRDYGLLSGAIDDLDTLGLKGWTLSADKGFEISQAPDADVSAVTGIQAGDIIVRLGEATGSKIARLSPEEQRRFKHEGGPISLLRNCQRVDFRAEKLDLPPEPIDPSKLSQAERQAIVNALYATGFYKPIYSPTSFVERGTIGEVQSSIAAFKSSRGAGNKGGLTGADVDYLVPLGQTGLPLDTEQSVLSQFLPNEIVTNTAAYLKRAGLFLDNRGYVDYNTRVALRDYLIAHGDAGTDGYLRSSTTARQLLSDPVTIASIGELTTVDYPGAMRSDLFGDWVYAKLADRCVIYTAPVALEGLIFRFVTAPGSPSPRIYLSVAENERGNAMQMNFGGSDEYAASGDITATFDNGESFALTHNDSYSFWPPIEGSGSSDVLHKALRNGHWMDIEGPSSYGGRLKIRYSAKGFSDAFKAMASDCSRSRIRDWLE